MMVKNPLERKNQPSSFLSIKIVTTDDKRRRRREDGENDLSLSLSRSLFSTLFPSVSPPK